VRPVSSRALALEIVLCATDLLLQRSSSVMAEETDRTQSWVYGVNR